VHLRLPVGVRRNFFRRAKTTFCLSVSAFRLLKMQRKLTNAKGFTLSAATKKMPNVMATVANKVPS